jgi:hypothetical protein
MFWRHGASLDELLGRWPRMPVSIQRASMP